MPLKPGVFSPRQSRESSVSNDDPEAVLPPTLERKYLMFGFADGRESNSLPFKKVLIGYTVGVPS